METETATVPAKAVVKPVPKRDQITRRALRQSLKLADSMRNRWRCNPDADHTLSDVTDPGYLWHSAEFIRPLDIIEIAHPFGLYYVELLVMKADKETQTIITRPITAFDWSAESMPTADLEDAKVERAGADGWRVRLDAAVLRKGFETRAEAQQWLEDRRAGKG